MGAGVRQQATTNITFPRQFQCRSDLGQQRRRGRRARVVGEAGIRDATGETPCVADCRFQRQPALADARRTGDDHHAGRVIKATRQFDQGFATPEKRPFTLTGQGVGRYAGFDQGCTALQIGEAEIAIPQQHRFLVEQMALRPRNCLAQGKAIAQVSIEGTGKFNSVRVVHRDRVPDNSTSDTIVEEGTCRRLSVGGCRLARIQHDKIEWVRRTNGAQQFSSGHSMRLPVFIFEQQTLFPGVTGDVQHMRVERLLEGAR